MTEHRAVKAEVRQRGPRTIEAVVMTYGVVDDYDTIFDPGCFTASLTSKLPRFVWSHDWSEPIGRAVSYSDTNSKLTVRFELDDPERVPRAGQAGAQLESGTLDEFSVGFKREAAFEDENGVTHFTKARLDEVSVVLAGAVPGTELLSMRSAQRQRALAEQLRDGTITPEQYRAGRAFADDVSDAEREADEALALLAEHQAEREADRFMVEAREAEQAGAEANRYTRERRAREINRMEALYGVRFVEVDPEDPAWRAYLQNPYLPWVIRLR